MQQSFDLDEGKLPKEFGMGCLIIKGAHLWPLSHVVWDGTAKAVGATYFCDLEAPWDSTNLLRIEVYKLPQAKGLLAEQLKWYTRDRKKRRIKIADGELFDTSMLHVKGLTEQWEPDAFPLSKSEIIRVYTGPKHAVIFRFLSRSGTLLDHPVFKRAARNIRFDLTQWVADVPDIIDTRPKRKRSTETPLTEEQKAELGKTLRATMKRLKLSKIKGTPARLKIVEQEITAARKDKTLTHDEKVDLAIELGSIAGQSFCKELEWEWCNVTGKDQSEAYCVCSPDRGLAIYPVDWIFELITDKKRPLNCILTFNMIEAGRLPPLRPHSYSRIG
ncbi:hypothetical protein [Aureliella helgolandensis]|uniref:Uncharacterized protein n=1 Tax=Aureliella helgolandensis TaxID=2527968 RepID=A0A518G7S7_9BACT|nr:hypothetical protein [Aureliella helgolandensis]QDV24641.1 hypothetical protein Q31a_29610 [Aureliella helgolandensis]